MALFQLTFAIITPALISGAVVERMHFRAWIAFVVLWSTFIYLPLAHMVWGGGFLGERLVVIINLYSLRPKLLNFLRKSSTSTLKNIWHNIFKGGTCIINRRGDSHRHHRLRLAFEGCFWSNIDPEVLFDDVELKRFIVFRDANKIAHLHLSCHPPHALLDD